MAIDILIRNGTIIDGSGAAAYESDIAIEGNRIKSIGKFGNVEAVQIIDARGKTVSPGFIDVHTHTDLYMNRDNLPVLFGPFVRQGITTMVTGNCGWGIAPVAKDNKGLFLNSVASLGVSIDKPFEWTTIDEYLTHVDRQGPVMNMAHLVPHGLLRMAVMGNKYGFASPGDITQMQSLLREGMEAGCYGFSTGLQYYPGLYSNTDEIIQLNSICGKYGGRYASHLRAYCTNFPDAVSEAIEIARKGGTGLQISHFHSKPFFNNMATLFYRLLGMIEAVNRVVHIPPLPSKALATGLEIVDTASREGLDYGMDMVPYVMANAPVTVLFPPWSLSGGSDAFINRLKDNKTWGEIKHDMMTVKPQWPLEGERAWSASYVLMMGWHVLTISSIPSEKNRHLEGKNFLDVASERNIDPFEAARQVTIEEKGRVMLLGGFSSKPWIEKLFSPLFTHPQMSVMTDAVMPDVGKFPQATYGAFPRYLGHYVRELKLVSLPDAIRKITSLPAGKYGIKGRGLIKEGYYADVVVFDERNIKDMSTPENPEVTPQGIDTVIINGKIVLHAGAYYADANAGRVLRKGH
jgi:N-acyl-D-aspartate/D-glutamate deacylase